jgi:hypothetical protein
MVVSTISIGVLLPRSSYWFLIIVEDVPPFVELVPPFYILQVLPHCFGCAVPLLLPPVGGIAPRLPPGLTLLCLRLHACCRIALLYPPELPPTNWYPGICPLFVPPGLPLWYWVASGCTPSCPSTASPELPPVVPPPSCSCVVFRLPLLFAPGLPVPPGCLLCSGCLSWPQVCLSGFSCTSRTACEPVLDCCLQLPQVASVVPLVCVVSGFPVTQDFLL